MKRLLIAVLFCSAAFAQNTVTVTANQIYSSGVQPAQLLKAGTAIFQATDANGKPISYQIGGGGIVVTTPTLCSITNGAIQSGCLLANTASATPANFCYQLTIKNSANKVVLGGPNSGYQCLQPTVANTWCTGAVCDLDNFQPTVPQKIFTIPTPTSTTLGGIFSTLCPFGQVANGYNSTGQPNCVTGGTSSGGGTWGTITGTLSNQADLQAALNLKANLTSPAFLGVPTAPTPVLGDNSNAIATTAYVNNFPIVWGHVSGNISNQADLWNYLGALAPLNNPAFTGTPTAPLQLLSDSSLTLATDQWVKNQLYAPLASPAFTGTPTAPTPPTADSSTAIATTAWVNEQGFGVGTGNVTGPVSATVGNIPLLAATNGQLLSDSGFGFPLDKSHIGTFSAGSNGFVTSAFVDTTNAANISGGTLAAARLPLPTTTAIGGVQAYNAVPQQFLTSITNSGVPVGRALVSADIPNNAANTTGNAASASALSAVSAIPNGTTGTTQSIGDATNKLATDAFVLANAANTVNPASQFSLPYYSAAGTNNQIAGMAAPLTPLNVPQTIGYLPSGGAVAPTTFLPALNGRAVTGATATDTISAADCSPNRIEYIGTAAAVAVTLPAATTLGVPHCRFYLAVGATSVVTLTPTTWTINFTGGSAVSSITINPGQLVMVSADPTGASSWNADYVGGVQYSNNNLYPASAVQTFGVSSTSSAFALGGVFTDPCCSMSAGSTWYNQNGFNGNWHLNFFDGNSYWTNLNNGDTPANMANGMSGTGPTAGTVGPVFTNPQLGNFNAISGTFALTTGDWMDLQKGTVTPYIQAVPQLGHIKTGYGSDNKYQLSEGSGDQNFYDFAQTVAKGTTAMTTGAISNGACGSTVTAAATGALSTDVISFSFNASVGANPGNLKINAWPTSNNVNFEYCNSTGGSVTPTAASINWRITR